MKEPPVLEWQCNELLNDICAKYEFTLDQMKCKRRPRDLVAARHVFFYLVLTTEKLTCVAAGRMLNRDHSTAIHGRDSVLTRLEYDLEFKNKYESFINQYIL